MVQAQSNNTGGQALEIGPPVLNLTADPGQVINSSINIRDVSKIDLQVTNEINDFTANGEDGTPQIILDKDKTSAYSIKSWIQPLDQITLKSKQLKSIPLTIYVPKDAAPGGYYGIVRFTGTPVGVEGNGVSLNASLGTLIFLRVSGDVKEQLSIEEFSANSSGNKYPIYEYKPITLTTRLKNSGNIYEQPTGLITVKDMFGKSVVTLPINSAERFILPDSSRKFDEVIDNSAIGSGLMFGHYTADIEVKYGSNGQTIKQTTDFWVIPYTLILVGVGLLIVLFFALRLLIRRYNRMVVRKATGYVPTKDKKAKKADKAAKTNSAPNKRRFKHKS